MSDAEQFVSKCLIEIGYQIKSAKEIDDLDVANTFYSQYQPIKGRRLRFDFALVKSKIAIEVDGDYWHGKTNTYLNTSQCLTKLNDAKKDEMVRSIGWKVLRITPNLNPTFKERLDKCLLSLLDV